MPAGEFKNILIRLPNWIGDVAMATPMLRAVRKSWPEAKITCLMLPKLKKVLEGSKYVDDFVFFEYKGLLKDIKMGRDLKTMNFDLAIVLPNSFTSAFVMWVAGIPRRIGYDLDKRGRLLTDKVKTEMEGRKRRPESMVTYYLRLVTEIGGVSDGEDLELPVSEESRRRSDEFYNRPELSGPGPVVGFNIGAAFGSSKLWPMEQFARTADLIIDNMGAKGVIFCGPDEAALADEMERAMKNDIVNTARDIVPLDDLKAYVRGCDLIVTTDSGPRHFAVAAGVPLVVVMGPTDQRLTNSNIDKSVVLQAEVACGPCHKKICPVEGHPCMTRTTPEMALDAARKLARKFFPEKLETSDKSARENVEK